MQNIVCTIKWVTLYLLFICLFTHCTKQNPDRKPNIILIMADDLGYGGIGCYGNEDINTPHLDSLAANGIRFTDFHSNGAVCTPTRAALLSGKYQQRTGQEGVIYVRGETRATGMDTSVVTMADLLQQAGYKTAITGKWHLGYDEKYNPVYQGFDEFYGYRSGNIDYHSHYDNSGIYDWYHNLDTIKEEGYVTDLITKHSVNFIEKNREQPFFLYVAHEAPHVPFQGRNDPAYRFPDKEFSYHGPVEDRHRAYKEMVEVMDESIGVTMKALKDQGLLKNTFVFFLSDNGGLQGYGDNGPLNGDKGTLYEGGHRVPAIAYWKDKIPAAKSDQLLMSFDLFPTIMAICDVSTPDDLLLDGVDFSALLFEQKPMQDRDLFWRYRDQKSVRSGSLKLLITKSDTLLYNLSDDLAESHDISNDQPEQVRSLLNKLQQWENEMDSYEKKTD